MVEESKIGICLRYCRYNYELKRRFFFIISTYTNEGFPRINLTLKINDL